MILVNLNDLESMWPNVSRTSAFWDWWPKSFKLPQSYTENQMISLPKCPKLRLVRCYVQITAANIWPIRNVSLRLALFQSMPSLNFPSEKFSRNILKIIQRDETQEKLVQAFYSADKKRRIRDRKFKTENISLKIQPIKKDNSGQPPYRRRGVKQKQPKKSAETSQNKLILETENTPQNKATTVICT